ncbi:hypothetical protein AVEN_9802-1 [Araneus ventricosus]|uniref:Integrase catalytic domain-containing protein n=1 Tax=Araneus ventricosus TaxID=182803 RepID=A0A4Y2ENW1_ARAVE|nr:hypothetical protein AVEN_9802-1 [Araneus ventricosus]
MCDPCQRVRKCKDKTKAPLTLVPIISEVFLKVNFDACGPLLTTPNGNRYLITAISLASKYPHAVPVPNIGSMSIIEAMIQIFSRMDFPKEIQTDQGTSFMSNLTIEFAEKFGIKRAPKWERQVHAALFALRTIRHESTGFTPSELVYIRNLGTPVTLLYEQWMNPEEEGNNVVEYVCQLINRLKRCKELSLDDLRDAGNAKEKCGMIAKLSKENSLKEI